MPRSITNFSRPADNTAYGSGDHIANSTTGASVTPMTFSFDFPKGLLISCQCLVTPASGNLVITGLDFDLLLFRPATNTPFAAGSYPADNAALTITPEAYREFVGLFSFQSGSWRNGAGGLTAAATGWQRAVPASAPMIQFDTVDLNQLIGVVQAKGAWTPTGVINRFDFTLEYSYP